MKLDNFCKIKKKFNKNYYKNYYLIGRITQLRKFKRIIFLIISNIDGFLQTFSKDKDIIKKKFNLGDLIYIKGVKKKTKSGEKSVYIKKIKILKKSKIKLPNKYLNINREFSYRNRYIDLAINSKSKKTFLNRFKFIKNIRLFMYKNNFIEVETPVINSNYEGGDSKPFETFHNYKKKKNFLRISPELSLKKLITGGFEKIFEIGKNFRNEGLSNKHNPEFSMIEFYRLGVNYKNMMKFTEKLIKYSFNKTLKKEFFKKKFKILSIKDAIKKYSKIEIDFNNKSFFLKNIKPKNLDIENIIYQYFDEKISKKINEPTFIINHPLFFSPLAKKKKGTSSTERFELYINGMEIANGFSELTSYREQKRRLIHIDKDYIKALKFGLPPCSGVGIGLDRLVMILTNNKSIKDVILFPTLK
ncbi:amino acid--tRNA ligase-related protein [Candidatus Vidania fulgoroideorum]